MPKHVSYFVLRQPTLTPASRTSVPMYKLFHKDVGIKELFKRSVSQNNTRVACQIQKEF